MTTYSVQRIFQLPTAASLALGSKMVIYDPNDGKDKQIDPNILVKGLIYDTVKFNTSYTPGATVEGEVWWNGRFYTPEYDTGLGATVTIGNNVYDVFYNDTGAIIPSGKNLHLKAGFVFGGYLYPTFEYADPRDWQKVQGTLRKSMHAVPNGALGLCAQSAQLISSDTSNVTAGGQLWIKPDGSGDDTDVQPQFPNISISVGGAYDSQVDGSVFYSVTSDINDQFADAWDGSCIETFKFTTTSPDGINVIGTLENADPTRNVIIKFSSVDRYTLDTTTAPLTIALTPGTDGNEVTNYVYVPESTKVLTVSTSGFPITEHAKIAELEIQSAATTQADGGTLGNQNTNDHLKTTGDNGHILHAFAWIREQFATMRKKYNSEATFDNTGGNGYISITGGFMLQAHLQELDPFSMIGGDEIRAWNDNGGLRPKLSNLASITAYSDGSAWNNEWGKIVVWRVGNETGEYSPVMFNLPSNGYNSEVNAIADLGNYADYSIPDNFKTKAVLIAAFTFRLSGGVITYSGGYEDLRGQVPITVAGGGGGGGGGGGVTTYLALTDTPNTRVGQAGKVLTANAGESADEYTEIHQNTPLLFWQYNNSTLDEAPGDGKFLIGSGFMNISNLFFGGGTVANVISNIKNGSTLYIQSRTDKQYYKSINVTGDAVDNTTYYKIPIAIFDEDSALVLDDVIGFNIFSAGSVQSIEIPFSQSLKIENNKQYSILQTQAAPWNFTKDILSIFKGGEYEFPADLNGNAVNYSLDFEKWRDDYVDSGNSVGRYRFLFNLMGTGEIAYAVAFKGSTLPAPTIDSFDDLGLNGFVDITFNESIYGDNLATQPVLAADLDIFNPSYSGVTNITITSIEKVTGGALVGGENKIRVHLTLTGTADGTETFEIRPSGAANIYNASGVAMLSTETTGTITLSQVTADLFADDFTGSTIDALKWNVVNPNSTIVSFTQNNQLEANWLTGGATSEWANRVDTDTKYNETLGVVRRVLAFDIQKPTQDFGGAGQDMIFGFRKGVTAGTDRIDIALADTAAADGIFCVNVVSGSVNLIDEVTLDISTVKTVKLIIGTNKIQFEYWSGSAWIYLTEVTVSVTGDWALALDARSNVIVPLETGVIDNVVVTDYNYNTQRP